MPGMMNGPDKRLLDGLVVGSDSGSSKGMKEGAEQDFKVAERAAAKDLMKALKADDAGAFVSAFRALYDICSEGEMEAEPDVEIEVASPEASEE